ncbi:HIT-like domain-containing protein [Cokeromyces recurvatus]|uniref:HIT-like domain-containing protein n=1 Tax=Cokeromyces recurvatus TaxID=90255 RepID=UPI00221EBD07|nr:HIT-like domain-containing protein [Cokeromyces recurvatus]KAI7899570.1 HIT-like domain-containing protein [Cokeromyces recurvatus]
MFYCCCLSDINKVCTFCNIKENIDSRIVFETDELIAFRDRSPSAKTHLLIIPKNHIETVKHLDGGDIVLLQKMIILGKTLLKEQGYNPDDTTQVR